MILGDSKYLKESIEVWNWFLGSKMINSHNLINDGLNLQTCAPGGTTFTYNQGVILGGLVELYQATKDKKYLEPAYKIADAATTSHDLNRDGILREPNEGDGCTGDGPSFKGIFVRNLGELSKVSSAHSYHNYLEKNANSCYDKNRNQNNEYGNHWAGPFKSSAGACQHGAVDLLTAAFKS